MSDQYEFNYHYPIDGDKVTNNDKSDKNDEEGSDGEEGDSDSGRYLGEGTYLRMRFGVRSYNSDQMTDNLISGLLLIIDRKYKPGPKLRVALVSLVCDLLWIASKGQDAYGYHGMSPKDFKRLHVAYRSFVDVVDCLFELGFIERQVGFTEHSGPGAKGHATRFRAAPKLIQFAGDFGITPAAWHTHFRRLPRPEAIPNPIRLKTARYYKKEGKAVRVNSKNATAQMLARQVDEINAFLSKRVIAPDRHWGFSRIFSQVDKREFDWNKGGRIYSVGEWSYQRMSKRRRPYIMLDGERAVEIDIRGSFPTILTAKRGFPYDIDKDPYQIAGLPREVVKSYVNMILGYHDFQKQWSKKVAELHEEKFGRDIVNEFPVDDVKAKVLSALPALRDWPESEIRWGDLQYVESQAVIDTVHALAALYDIPALPVHDSLIVPISKTEIATQLLSDMFLKYVGVRPFIKATRPVYGTMLKGRVKRN